MADMKEKLTDPEYAKESYWMNYLHWMMKVLRSKREKIQENDHKHE